MKLSDKFIDSKICLICGSNELYHFTAQAYDAPPISLVDITECKDCTFAWQYPLNHTEQQSIEIFETAYTDKGKTQSGYFIPEQKLKIAKLELDFISSLPTENKTLLDIGAGAGIFAEAAAENGWSVTAVDPALDINQLNNKPGINAIKGTTGQIHEGQLFDIVTLWDVIEHVTAPQELISHASKFLKKGGWLVIETGNYKSSDRVNGGKKHWIYQNDHRWYFAPSSVQYLLESSGFSEFIHSEKVLRPDWTGSVNYAGPSCSNLLKSIIKNPFSLFTHLNTHANLTKAKEWEMAGIGIFTIAARVC
ncbi:MAG: class I SAM-dependent methyltransferase [Emcibacter sp.]|nr:class I SAM-dependent methyltransferase [Emcibacter sp.]